MVHCKLHISYRSWKTWKVAEFYNFVFQAWKFMKQKFGSWKVIISENKKAKRSKVEKVTKENKNKKIKRQHSTHSVYPHTVQTWVGLFNALIKLTQDQREFYFSFIQYVFSEVFCLSCLSFNFELGYTRTTNKGCEINIFIQCK